jgi:hypothetical protein
MALLVNTFCRITAGTMLCCQRDPFDHFKPALNAVGVITAKANLIDIEVCYVMLLKAF